MSDGNNKADRETRNGWVREREREKQREGEREITKLNRYADNASKDKCMHATARCRPLQEYKECN